MEFKIVKMDGEFVIVEFNDGKQKVCPVAIFPKGIVVGNVIKISVVKE